MNISDRKLYTSYYRMRLCSWKHKNRKKIHMAIVLAALGISLIVIAAISNPEGMTVFEGTSNCKTDLKIENETVYMQSNCNHANSLIQGDPAPEAASRQE
ncbi:MAG: hypothetical protein ABIF10_03995 [Candidatus Woesearchaeota archaeon]